MGNRHLDNFNRIAPLYGLFFPYQVRYYRRVLDRAAARIAWPPAATVIDIGCGTGALCEALSERGMQVTGVDGAEKMLAIARRKLRGRPVTLVHQDVLEKRDLPDKGFDIAIASYMLHGFPQKQRLRIYGEMARLARERVIVHDFTGRRAWYIDLIEGLEGSAYRDFIGHAEEEMAACFGGVHVIEVDTRAAWYWAKP